MRVGQSRIINCGPRLWELSIPLPDIVDGLPTDQERKAPPVAFPDPGSFDHILPPISCNTQKCRQPDLTGIYPSLFTSGRFSAHLNLDVAGPCPGHSRFSIRIYSVLPEISANEDPLDLLEVPTTNDSRTQGEPWQIPCWGRYSLSIYYRIIVTISEPNLGILSLTMDFF